MDYNERVDGLKYVDPISGKTIVPAAEISITDVPEREISDNLPEWLQAQLWAILMTIHEMGEVKMFLLEVNKEYRKTLRRIMDNAMEDEGKNKKDEEEDDGNCILV